MSLENFPNFLLNFSECGMNGEENHFYQFKSFRLNIGERQLLHNNSPVSLTPKAFDVLAALVERSGHLVEKEELLRLVWADSFVEEANIPRIIHTLRKTLGEDENGNKFIETVAKKGYRFVAEVTEASESDDWSASVLACHERPSFGREQERDYSEVLENETPFAPLKSSNAWQARTLALQSNKTRIILFVAGFAGALLLVSLLAFNWRSEPSLDPNAVKSIAVLPLNSLAAEKRDPLYELGIADSLIFNLSRVKNLTVRPLSATQSYADAKKDAVAAGREQKVDYVLASNYQIADGKIRITSQLINVSTGAVEEIFKNEQNIADGFAVQDAVASNVSRKLLTKLNRESSNPAAKRYTNSEEAYRLYLQGRALADKRTRKNAEKAIEYLEQAVKIDPNYALAYAALANARIAAGNFGEDHSEQYPKAKAAAEKALEIDDNLADAHAFAGEVKFISEWDFAGAEREFRRAVELDRNSVAAHQLYAVYLNSMGRFEEAEAEIKTAIDLEPASALNHRLYGMVLYFARRFDESIVENQRAVEIDADFRTAYWALVEAYRMKGDDDKAFEWFLRAPHRKDEPPEKLQFWKEIYAKSGWRGILQRQIKEALEKNGKTPVVGNTFLANSYAELGDWEQALNYLEKGVAERRGWLWIKVNPKFDPLHGNPRFDALLRRVGLK